jgi:hypothetical protein
MPSTAQSSDCGSGGRCSSLALRRKHMIHRRPWRWIERARAEGRAAPRNPHDRPRHRPAHAHGAAAGERLCDDRRRAAAAGIASAITVFGRPGSQPILKNGGTLEKAAAMANHASTRDLRPVGEGTDDLRAERFANDSPLEERGFEPLVPRTDGVAFPNTFLPPRAAPSEGRSVPARGEWPTGRIPLSPTAALLRTW